ncbi:MAG: PadR family transcriptional regulator [Okeania sp. SIO2D1]|nr:PadR family transcriptional regulator [Okeania sp. SIO2D1]
MSLAYAILATLASEPASGYDLAKKFDTSVGFFWQASHQQIYRELNKLEEKEWIEAETVFQEGRPNKKVYTLTTLGKQKMIEWIAKPGKISRHKEEVLVKLFAGYLVPPRILIRELERHRQLHLRQLEKYKGMQQKYFANPPSLDFPSKCQYLSLRQGIRYEHDYVGWCEEAISLLQEDLSS